MNRSLRLARLGTLCLWGLLLIAPLNRLKAQYVAASKSNMKVIQPLLLDGRELGRYRMFSVADALRYNSGLLFKDYNGLAGFKTVNVRSLGSERTHVFFNGIELGNALNGQIDLSRFGMANMGSMSLYQGARGDIYQSATDFASSSSLYLEYRRPSFAEEKKTNFSAMMRGGAFMTFNPSLMYEHQLSERLSTSFNFDLLTSRGNYPYDFRLFDQKGQELYHEKGSRANGKIHAVRADASLHGRFSKGLWSVTAYAYGSERGVPGAIINHTTSYRGERLTERTYFVQGDARFFVSQAYRTKLAYKLSENYIRLENSDSKVRKVDDSWREYGAYISSQHLYEFNDMFKLSGAYDANFSLMRKWNQITDRAYKNFADPWRVKHLGSLAGSFSWKGLSASASVYGTFVQNAGKAGYNPYKDEMAVSPSLVLSYKPFTLMPFYVQAYAKKSYRVPNYNDRFVSHVLGERLKPEDEIQYDFGLMYDGVTDGRFREFGLTLDAYYKDIKDKIIAYPTGELIRWTMDNLGKVRVLGGTATGHMRFRFTDDPKALQFKTKLQYTYQRAQDITSKDDLYYENQIPYIPWHSGSAILSLLLRGWSLNYSFLYVGDRYSRQENIAYYKMQPWYNHDVSLGKRFQLEGGWRLNCMLEVNNILGEDFEIVTNYPMPKQSFRLTVNVEM
ncbi:MAG: TonB-dependent receptor [Bacteroidia bacterium]|nr:MAG: TonB-dependent receptor [Bacteroidia bacterium]